MAAFASPSSDDAYWDGTVGVSSPSPIGIWAITAAGTGEFFTAGYFNSLNGSPATNIARWTENRWQPLGPGLGGQGGETVKALAASGPTLYAAGAFDNSGELPLNNLACWDGHAWRDVGGGVNGAVSALTIHKGDLYAAGLFTSAGGVPALNIARWDGTNWFPLGTGLSKLAYSDFPPFPAVEAASASALLSSGTDLFVGGTFHTAGGIAATNIARWDGKSWHPVGTGLVSSGISALSEFRGNLYVGGIIRVGSRQANIAMWDGHSWSSPGGGVDDGRALHALATDGRNLYAGGTFRQIGGIPASRIARWDGRQWHPLGSGIDPLNNSSGIGDLICTSGQLLIAGVFNLAGNQPASNLALWHTPRTVQLAPTLDGFAISWPAPDANFVLETTHSCTPHAWSEVSQSPILINNRWIIITNCTDKSFFRLRLK